MEMQGGVSSLSPKDPHDATGTETHIRKPVRGSKSPGRGVGWGEGDSVCLLLVAATASLAEIKSGLGLFKKR